MLEGIFFRNVAFNRTGVGSPRQYISLALASNTETRLLPKMVGGFGSESLQPVELSASGQLSTALPESGPLLTEAEAANQLLAALYRKTVHNSTNWFLVIQT